MPNSVFKYKLEGKSTKEGKEEWEKLKKMCMKLYPLTEDKLEGARKVMDDGMA